MSIRTDHYAPDFLIKINGKLEFRHGTSTDVISISVTEAAEQADSFTFTLRAHHPTPGRFAGGGQLSWIDDARFDEFNRVEIEMGYVNNRALRFVGKITGTTPSFPESGAPTLSVRGLSLYSELQRDRRRKPFDAKTDSGIVREIANDLGLTADVDDTQVQHPIVSTRGTTYASILQGRAERLYYEVTVKQERLIFRPPGYLENPSPTLTLVWGESLRSFSPVLSTSGLASEVEVRNTQSSHGGDKEALSATATAAQVAPVLGKRSGAQIAGPAITKNKVLCDDQLVTTAQEAAMVARAQYQRRAINYITGRGSCIGNPQLQSRQVIELKGLGQRFSGNYYVTSTTHTIDAGGYRTDFEVKRDGR